MDCNEYEDWKIKSIVLLTRHETKECIGKVYWIWEFVSRVKYRRSFSNLKYVWSNININIIKYKEYFENYY